RRDWGAVHAELALEPGSRGAPVLRVGGYEHSHRGEAAVAVALGEMEGPGDLQDAAVGPDRSRRHRAALGGIHRGIDLGGATRSPGWSIQSTPTGCKTRIRWPPA